MFLNIQKKCKCKICGALVSDVFCKKKHHITKFHEGVVVVQKMTVKQACNVFFESSPEYQTSLFKEKEEFKYKCKLCGKTLDAAKAAKAIHFETRHKELLNTNGLTLTKAINLFCEPLKDTNIEEVLSNKKDFKKTSIKNLRILLDGVRGKRIEERHICTSCKAIRDNVWVYNTEKYNKIYLCNDCHDRLKPKRIFTKTIYTAFETDRRKH